MYLCLCNGLTSGEVERIVDDGYQSVAGVYRHLGCRPNCGKCVGEVKQIVKTRATNSQARMAALGAD